MKKSIISFLLIFLTFSLFYANSFKSKKIHNNNYLINYEIKSEEEELTTLTISSELGLDLKIKVLFNNYPDALNFVMAIEDTMGEIFLAESGLNYLRGSDSAKLLSSPIKFLIDELKEEDFETTWTEDPVSGEYYYQIDLRTTIGSCDGDENGIVTLTVLDYADQTDPNFDDNTKYIWDAFEKSHPNIKIKRKTLFGDDFSEKLDDYTTTRRMPDVFYMWPAGRSYAIHDKKLAKDLTPFLKQDGIYENYSKAVMNPSMQRAGYIAEIPSNITVTNCMIANTKLLKELGLKPAKTYDELKAQLPILKAAGKELIIMANEEDWVMQSCLFSMVCGRIAGPYWASDIISGRASFTDKPFLSAVEMIKKMYDDGVLSQESLETGYGFVTHKFANGDGAYFIDGDWRTGAFITDRRTGEALISPKKQASDIEIIQFPKLPGEIIHNSNSGIVGTGYGMSSALKPGSAKEKAAWELIKWLSGPEMQQRSLDTGASFPSLTKGIDDSGLDPILQKRLKFYGEQEILTPVFDSYFSTSVSAVINEKLQQLGLGEVTPMQVCEAVQAAFEEDYY